MNRRLSLIAIPTLAGIAAIAAASGRLAAQSQSLADVANKGAQQSSGMTTPSKAYTNADVSPAPCGQDQSSVPVSKDSGAAALDRPAAPASEASLPLPSLEAIVKAATPAVVTIETASATGTGFFVAPGLVLTNTHVIDGASSMRVRFFDGGTSSAFVSSLSPDTDLALVRVVTPPSPQPTLALGRANGVQVGEDVLAIGSPLGLLRSTVTRGIVSAVRTIGDVTYVQTDAAINRGNSGGPLIDKHGRVIGITTLKFTSGESLGFAIAADHAWRLIQGRNTVSAARGGCGSSDGGREPLRKDDTLETIFGRPRKSDTERAIDAGAAQFEQTTQSVARQADAIDAWWQRYQAGCATRAVRRVSGGRDWFGIWTVPAAGRPDTAFDSAFADSDARPECRAARASVIAAALPVRTVMSQAEERARRDGVPPGIVRGIRQKYAMEWSSWDR